MNRIDTNQLNQANRAYNANRPQAADVNDWEDFDAPLNGPGAQRQVNGRRALQGARVLTLAEDLRNRVPARHSFGKSLLDVVLGAFRSLMKVLHHVYNGATGAVEKRHRAGFDRARQARFPGHGRVRVEWPVAHNTYRLSDGSTVPTRNVVRYTPDEIGAAMGLGGPTRVKLFSDAERQKIVDGDFRLEDITQDSNLQNCWFLSSLASVLSFKGAAALQRIITIPQGGADNDGCALVKLGTHTYKVPLGDVVSANGKTGTSASAAWVRLLETAMQMHMVKMHQLGVSGDEFGINVDMNGGTPKFALGALLGLERIETVHLPNDPADDEEVLHENVRVIRPDTLNVDRIGVIRRALDANHPVVLGSSKDKFQTIKYGFSPDHAVSVQDVEVGANGRTYLHVLDPYGRSVVVDADILQHGATIFIAEANHP